MGEPKTAAPDVEAEPAAAREKGLERLYRLYAPWLASRLRRRFGPDAEDIVQETYLRASSTIADDGVRHPRALLLRIASNIGVDAGRRQSRHDGWRSRLSSAGAGDGEDGGQEEVLLFKQIVASMPAAQRQVFLLSRVGGLSYDAISERLDVPVKTIEWRMSKALAHCASKMRD